MAQEIDVTVNDNVVLVVSDNDNSVIQVVDNNSETVVVNNETTTVSVSEAQPTSIVVNQSIESNVIIASENNSNIIKLGGENGDLHFMFIQSSPSTTWTINHNLGKFPAIQAVNSANQIVFGDIQHLNNNNARITWSGPLSGKAYLN